MSTTPFSTTTIWSTTTVCTNDVEYRIYKRNDDYFPHVRFKGFLFWKEWHRIGEHPHGFGLYPINTYDHPKTMEECRSIIKDFHQWIQSESVVNEQYINFVP